MSRLRAALLAGALLAAAPLGAAVWTVCATGCDDTTILAAYGAAAAGDTINVEGSVVESDNFNRGINVTVESTDGSSWTGVSSAPTLQFQNGNDSTVVLSGLTLDNQGDQPDLDWGNNGTADVVVDVEGCVLQNSSGASAPLVDVDDANTEVVFITQSSLAGNGSAGQYGVELSGGINSLAISAVNTLFYGFSGTGSAGVYADNGNSWGGVSLQNDTFFNNAWGYYDASSSANGSSYTSLDDNVFIGDASGDVHLDTANATVQGQEEAACVGNLFGDQASAAGYGSGNIYLDTLGLSASQEASQEFVDPLTSGTPNLHELSGAWSICAAVDDAQMPSVDKDGNARPSSDCGDGAAGDTNGGGYDIGAYQYTGPSASPTASPSATPSPGATATPSPSSTAGPSATPSATPSPTASATEGATPEPTGTPAPFRLTPHYPNPDPAGSSGVYLPYSLSAEAKVTVRVYDVSGELVRSWSGDPDLEEAGDQQRFWDALNGSGKACASGVFLVQIDASPTGPGSRQEAWEKCALAR